jgi:hypothetical protein
MTHDSLVATLHDRVDLVSRLLVRIECEGCRSSLGDLRVLLLNMIGTLARDPGIETAVEDLYEAAAVIVAERSAGIALSQRRRRLMRDAHRRLRERLDGASETIGRSEPLGLQGLAALYAAQIARQFGLSDSRLVGLTTA